MGSETWKPVASYEGLYEVSDQGRVRRVPGFTSDGHKHKGGLIAPQIASHGYPVAGLSKNGRVKQQLIHRMVLEAFEGPCPEGNEARHLDGDRANPSASNLRWGTPLENAADKEAHGTVMRGGRHGAAKLTDAQVVELRRRCHAKENYGALAAEYGIKRGTVRHIACGLSRGGA